MDDPEDSQSQPPDTKVSKPVNNKSEYLIVKMQFDFDLALC